MTIALVTGQTAYATSTAASVTATLPNTPVTGNLVVAMWGVGHGSAPGLTVQDGNGVNFTASASSPFLNTSTVISSIGIYGLVVPATPSKTVTITITGNIFAYDLFIAEFSGAATSSIFEIDGTHLQTTAVTSVVLPSITTTNNGDLLLAFVYTNSDISSANSPWTGWASGVPASGNYAEYLIQSTAGARAVNFTQTSGTCSSIEAAIKASGTADVLQAQQWL